MAMATCTSELTVSVIGTFLAESDLGVGTVVGSGVYNTLGVPACAGLAAGRPVSIGGWPLFRDSGVYVTSIAVLAAIAVDSVVEWYEALVMVAMYVGYFCFLFAQARLANRPADEPSPDDAARPFPSPREYRVMFVRRVSRERVGVSAPRILLVLFKSLYSLHVLR